MDGAREQTLGDFRKKCRKASCHLKQMEPCSSWMNVAENGVHELDQSLAWWMLKKHSPKGFGAARFCPSHMAGNHLGLNEETPERRLSGEPAGISEFAECGWCDWIKFRDTNVPRPEDKLLPGRCLGSSTNMIDPAVMAKMLKQKDHCMHGMTFHGLTKDEIQDQKMKPVPESHLMRKLRSCKTLMVMTTLS